MIYIDRTTVSVPKILRRKQFIEDELKKVKESFGKQRQFEFNRSIYVDNEVKESLIKLFHNKCAYCESLLSLGAIYGEIDHFRPKSRALGLDGKISPKHYWWLVYKWSNLYLSCPLCNRMKANRFPVKGMRLSEESKDIKSEQYILLDPCNEKDHLKNHLVFTEDGKVISETHSGQITIEILDLNRLELVQERNRVCSEIKSTLSSSLNDKNFPAILIGDIIPQQFDPVESFSAMRRQIIYRYILNLSARRRQKIYRYISKNEKKLGRYFPDLEKFLEQEDIISLEESQKLNQQYTERKEAQVYSVFSERKKDKKVYFQSTKWIEKIEIRNFKPIKNLTIEFPKHREIIESENFKPIKKQMIEFPNTKMVEPLVILLGENATGKSSILQAIALALMGQENCNKLDLDASSFVRKARGVSSGEVKVYLTSLKDPIILYFSKQSEKFKTDPKDPQVLILGYGSTRLLPKSDHNWETLEPYKNLKSLFDPHTKLKNVKSWLADTSKVSTRKFDSIAIALKKLLMLEEEDIIKRREHRLYVKQFDNLFSFDELSDGYQSVTVLALDIMMAMAEKWESIEDAEGMVFIDEIEVHLHPQWKIKIIDLFREVFPRIRFMMTTHDPLCLRGAYPGEVHILTRNVDTKEIEINQFDVPKGVYIDELLTGEWFMMSSTLDKDTSRLFEEYKELILQKGKKIEERKRKVERDLKDILGAYADNTFFGIYKEVISEYVKKDFKKFDKEDRKILKNKIYKQVKK